MRQYKLLIILFLFSSFSLEAQNIGEYLGDERALYAETKQVNQFFRRFNSEESTEGVRYHEGHEMYRDHKNRLNYLNMLFDSQTSSIPKALKKEFINDVSDKNDPVYLDFHGGNWFAEVNAKFTWQGKEERAILYMKLQEEEVGSKWIISKVYFEPFNQFFKQDTVSANRKFLHPLSHELDFMNLHKVFRNNELLNYYTERGFRADHLTLFLYEVKKGNIQFETISQVKFHFFQIDNWYFELSEFNRSGYNTGWLISNLVKINDREKDMLLKYIHNEK